MNNSLGENMNNIKTLSDNKIWGVSNVSVGTGITYMTITNNLETLYIHVEQHQFWEYFDYDKRLSAFTPNNYKKDDYEKYEDRYVYKFHKDDYNINDDESKFIIIE